ncbi:MULTISPECIES: hypothetical protein [unclassified Stenotrophomonas]|uniref:hypothetical protein n=1 Tax=unclassified Stenotrophomonas TaxID=196198 RepID=UPI00130FDBCA|nr:MULTISPECIES: hypothetical protein [unclassified Stenotrophomonas]
MKLGELTAFGHNVADSLASGMCFMIGLYTLDIFAEAAASREGEIVVNFLTGEAAGSPASAGIKHATGQFAQRLPELASQHGLDIGQIRVLSARFGTDKVAGRHFQVSVETADGRRSMDQYVGSPGRRYSRARRSRVAPGTD